MKNDRDIQQIEDYFDGLLTEKEQEDFLKRVETDEAFAKAYHLRKKTAELWKESAEYQQIKQQVRTVMNNKSPVIHKNKNFYYFMAVAASVILLLGIYWFFLRQDGFLSGNSDQRMAMRRDSIVLHTDRPEKLTTIQYKPVLFSPANNAVYTIQDTLTFRWKIPDIHGNTILVIRKRNTHTNLYKLSVTGKDTTLLFTQGKLAPGNYEWFVHDTNTKRYFTIK